MGALLSISLCYDYFKHHSSANEMNLTHSRQKCMQRGRYNMSTRVIKLQLVRHGPISIAIFTLISWENRGAFFINSHSSRAVNMEIRSESFVKLILISPIGVARCCMELTNYSKKKVGIRDKKNAI